MPQRGDLPHLPNTTMMTSAKSRSWSTNDHQKKPGLQQINIMLE